MKAQISAQIFIYILAAVIIGVILLVGSKAVGTILGFGSRISIDSFKSDFQNVVETNARQYGSVKKYEFTLPDKFDEICFVDSMNEDNEFDFDANVISMDYNFIRNSVENDVKINVFLLNKKKIEESFYVDKLEVKDNNYLCLSNQGITIIWLRGSGKKAELYTQ